MATRNWNTSVEIGLACGLIEEIHNADLESKGGHRIDAIAVGHYLGVRPQDAERALDRSISAAFGAEDAAGDPDQGIITQYADRGIIRGDLGQPFFLVDPRTGPDADAERSPRLIVIAGMGPPARFGTPELTVLARELCWSLGRMGRRHLATVVIGGGNGNLPLDAAISAWIRGVKRAITGVVPEERIARVTFVVRDGRKLREVQAAIESESARLKAIKRAELTYDPMPESLIRTYEQASIRGEIEKLERQLTSPPSDDRDVSQRLAAPTRLTVDSDGGTYRFGAITARAAVPERAISLDRTLVLDVNSQLANAPDFPEQRVLGRLLAGLLFPEEFRPHLEGSAPLSLLLDGGMAKLHWEMLTPPDAPEAPESDTGQSGSDEDGIDEETFLGTSRGLTRQLRAAFAAPPQPPPPARRRLRVMIIANPAREAPLPGAEDEGRQIADLFNRFNEVYARDDDEVDVQLLLGPDEATRSAVLGQLIDKSFDVLHFVGHSVYQDRRRPPRAGWLFTDGTYLAASELNRLDRMPEFVFSNSCSSGVLSDPERWTGSAPTLASTFFARGVGNFVCTAWPIDDGAGLEFARVFYSKVLGLELTDGEWKRAPRQPMSEAMRMARIAVANTRGGRRIWGAYQHYGNPHSRLLPMSSSTDQ